MGSSKPNRKVMKKGNRHGSVDSECEWFRSTETVEEGKKRES
ncbi:hypothetical protein SDC9_60349 [bioreactor metagenome]|uniref:Uncharacterized protein n=1 Tax=bioreactor metagenome TaxID=1076179 RepID=A0A644XD15_9ZZZZ